MVTAAAATVVVVAIALLVVAGRPGSATDPLGAAVAQVSTGRQGLKLAQERQQVILQDAATQAFTVTSAPKISTAPPPLLVVGEPVAAAARRSCRAVRRRTRPPPRASPTTCCRRSASARTSSAASTTSGPRESGWRYNAENASGAYGIPQALPGSKMASAGPDWQTNPTTQIKWGLGYIKGRYGSPCQAWAAWQAQGWY